MKLIFIYFQINQLMGEKRFRKVIVDLSNFLKVSEDEGEIPSCFSSKL